MYYKKESNKQYIDEEAVELLSTIGKWRIHILITTIVAAFAAIIFSGPAFLTPKFKAECIAYPPATNSEKVLIEHFTGFGGEKEIDEYIQILKSGIVRDSIITNFGLMKHYEIDSSKIDRFFRLYKIYDKNVLIDRTRYNSVSIEVYDTDPLTAAEIANEIVVVADRVKNAIIKKNFRSAYNSLELEYMKQIAELDSISNSITTNFPEYNMGSADLRKRVYAEKLKDQIDVREAIDEARKKRNPAAIEMLYKYESNLVKLNELQESVLQAGINLNSTIPPAYVITPAEVSFKKVYPIRWLIVVVTTVGVLLITSLMVVIISKIKNVVSFIQNPD